METTKRPWLDRLKQHLSTAHREDIAPETPTSRTDTTDTTGCVGCVGSLDEAFGDEIAWRVAAYRQQIPAHGPIPLLYARQEAKGPRTPGCCGSCGDLLPAGRTYTCAPCQRAEWIALDMGEPPQAREYPGASSALVAVTRTEGRAS